MSDTNTKKVNKKTIISIVKVIAFLLALVVILQLLSKTFFAKERTGQYADTKYYYSMIYTNEKPDTIQVGLFGNSDLYSAFCPTGMFYQYGYTGTVVAAPRQTTAESYWYLNDFIQNQNPELVIFECDMLYKSVPDDFENGDYYKKKGMPVIPFLNDDSLKNKIERDYPVFLFHDRWKQYLIPILTKDEAYTHGYYFNKHVETAAQRSPYIEPNDKLEPIDEDEELYIRMACELCEDNGIEFMLMSVPSANTWSYSRHNAVQALCDELGIKFLDMSIEPEGLNINYKKDFRDEGNHLNYYGAKKTTEYAGKFIYENYNLTNNRYNEDYSQWIDDLNRLYEEKGVVESLHFKTMV